MYDRAHYLMTVGGTVLNGAEIWQTGLRYAPMVVTAADELLQALNAISVSDILDDMGEVIGNNGNGITYGKDVAIKWCKVAVIGTNGHYAGAPKIAEGNVPGTNNLASGHPPQSALVATLGTGAHFGTAQKGRMYWPLPGSMAGALNINTGQLPSAQTDQFRDLVIQAIDHAGGEIGTVQVPTVASVMSISGGVSAPQAPGTTRFITEISVGRVVDTQRRRRSALVEAYAFADSQYGRSLRTP